MIITIMEELMIMVVTILVEAVMMVEEVIVEVVEEIVAEEGIDNVFYSINLL